MSGLPRSLQRQPNLQNSQRPQMPQFSTQKPQQSQQMPHGQQQGQQQGQHQQQQHQVQGQQGQQIQQRQEYPRSSIPKSKSQNDYIYVSFTQNCNFSRKFLSRKCVNFELKHIF